MKVDVLAVMEAACAALDVVYSQDDLRKDLLQARAAVAELIEAAKSVVDNENEPRFLYGEIESLRAAIAKVSP